MNKMATNMSKEKTRLCFHRSTLFFFSRKSQLSVWFMQCLTVDLGIEWQKLWCSDVKNLEMWGNITCIT